MNPCRTHLGFPARAGFASRLKIIASRFKIMW
jgi:hypothetical protein